MKYGAEEMTRRNYNGYSEACLDCKRFFDGVAPCNTCEYRIQEERLLLENAKVPKVNT
jgi:hypothetical protein